MIACVTAALIAGAIYLSRAIPAYSSTAVILIQQSVPKIFADKLSDSPNSTSYLATQCQLIQSTRILAAAATMPEMAGVTMLRGAENPVGLLKRGLTATISKQGDLINVSMESTDPRDAAVIVNAVVQAYIEYQSNTHKSLAIEAVRIFQKEVDQHEAELKTTEDAMLKLRQQTPELTFVTKEGTNLSFARLSELTQQRDQAESLEQNLREAAAIVSAGTDTVRLRLLLESVGLASITSVGPDPQAVAAYQQAARVLQNATDKLGPKHPTTLLAQLDFDRATAEMNRSAVASTSAALELLVQKLQLAKEQKAKLQTAVNDAQAAAVRLSDKGADYLALSQQAVRIDKLLDTLDTQIKSVDPNEDVGALTVSVLESAKPSGSPIRPQKSQAMGMALVVGLMAGLGGALLRDLSDHRLRSAEEIGSVLGLPILGAVPHMLGKHLPADRGLETHVRPRSDVAEAYRTVRTAIYFGLAEQQVARTLLVTSPSPGDGKSTSAANLAVAMAQAGRRVLLVDADCRRPVQHKLFKLDASSGLCDVLIGRTTIEEAVRPTMVERLSVLPCGPLPPNPAELLDSQAFLNLLGRVSALYDQVVIDSPPVVPVTDARILSASCDATVLVLRAEKSTRRLAEYARDGLASVGANMLGVIVNDVPRGKDGYGYYYYGYGTYGGYSAKPQDAAVHAETNGHAKPALAGTVDTGSGRLPQD